MNVLIVGKFYAEGFALHIAETLTDMGHAAHRYEPGIRSGRFGGRLGHRAEQVRGVIHAATDSVPWIRRRRMKALWRLAGSAPIELVIVCHDFLWPDEVAELKRRTGAKLVMWFPDHLANFGRGFFMNAPYDALFFKDPYIVNVLRDVIASPVYYLPECFNPDKHWFPETDGRDDGDYRCDITTAGNMHSWRLALFRHMSEYDVKLWGKAPPLWMPMAELRRMYQGRPVFNHDKVRAFRGAKVVLNTLHYAEIWGVNVRTFEAAGAGAFQMVDWRPGLGQLFVEGEEIVSFHGVADMKAKLRRYLPDEGARKSIAAAGMRRAFADHTYRVRLGLLLSTVAGEKAGFPMPRIADMNPREIGHE